MLIDSLLPSVSWNTLLDAARAVRMKSYSPYSNFAVAAALLDGGGRIFTGVNVENASYGATICAERSAVVAAVTAGARRFMGMVVLAPGPKVVSPCGMCRQVLSEFTPSFPVRCYTPEGEILETDVAALLPHVFNSDNLKEID